MLATVHDIQGAEARADLYVAPDLKIQTVKSSSKKELFANAQLKSTSRTKVLFSGASIFL